MIATTSAFVEYVMPDDAAAAKATILQLIASAQESLRLAMFGFTDHDIATALLAASTRLPGAVWLLLDHDESIGPIEVPLLHWLLSSGFPADHLVISTSTKHAYMHSKVLIADAGLQAPDRLWPSVDAAIGHYPLVAQGSLNFTKAGLLEDNTLMVMPGKVLAAALSTLFTAHVAWTLAHEPAYQLKAS